MRFTADLHIHSRYARATSREMTPETIWRWAQLKGITVVGTGDFTHPAWLAELKEKLKPVGSGLFSLRKDLGGDVFPSCISRAYFLLSSEISCIFSRKGKARKTHMLIFVPDFGSAERLRQALAKIGNLGSDGRPILGLDAKELLRITIDRVPDAIVVPAHAWTPHFSVFGAASGFDSLEECFEELTPHIRAVETGLSSDPAMNWRLSALDDITLISNSDAHSPAKMGREACILDTDVSYDAIKRAVETRDGFLGTIEFFPEEGKYHHDGHRACGVNLSPAESLKHKTLCPVCGKRLTLGVLHRVEALADRKPGFRPPNCLPYHSLIPLQEVVAETMKAGVNTKKVTAAYFELLKRFGNEFRILLDVPAEDIGSAGFPGLSRAIARMRSGDVSIVPGYDGEYGKVSISDRERNESHSPV
jgi:uncharacterized protein (TIGR00375 family)